ncbi:hypothetical protein EVAR_51874_1 [Eumeta japonica]|uniref:Uncharacterized protein n=1 Tax=Eumeta variegata TaxID=151549 RepID=A0A4C1YLN7_EUMVA|nr:hypothetical protein EVAR_51874_1 [Eumeta japonica]
MGITNADAVSNNIPSGVLFVVFRAHVGMSSKKRIKLDDSPYHRASGDDRVVKSVTIEPKGDGFQFRPWES